MSSIEEMINSVMNDPEQMKKVMDMAGNLLGSGVPSGPTGGEETSPALSPAVSELGGLNLNNILSGLGKLPGGLAGAASSFLKNIPSSSEDKTGLLEAMKPWLSEKRRTKLDGAMKIAMVMKNAGSAFLGGGGSA